MHSHSSISGVWGLVLYYLRCSNKQILGQENVYILCFLQYLSCPCPQERRSMSGYGPHQFLVQDAQPVNASICMNKQQDGDKASFISLLNWGTQTFGTVSSGTMKQLKQSRVCSYITQPWGAHQEGSCEPGILSFPYLYILNIKIVVLLVRGLWWPTCPGQLRPLAAAPLPHCKLHWPVKARWTVSFLSLQPSANLWLWSPGWVVWYPLLLSLLWHTLKMAASLAREHPVTLQSTSPYYYDWYCWELVYIVIIFGL